MSRHRLRVWIVAAVVVAFTAVSAIVFAEWLATGTGEGNAAAGTAVELRVEPADGIGGDSRRLVPGGTGDVEAVLYNDNPYDVEVREITQVGLITSDQTGCDGTSGEVTFTNQVGSWVVAANGELSVRLADALAMGVDSANECQGAEFAVPLAVTGGSSVGTGTTSPPGSAEVCDGIDNDLNALVDDGLGPYCLSGIPAANTDGDSACLGGFFDVDMDPANGCEFRPTEEVCDGIDNDLDGTVDENWPVSEMCYTPGGDPGIWLCLPDGTDVWCAPT